MTRKTRLKTRLRRGQLTPHFNIKEFRCHDGTGYVQGLRKYQGLSRRKAKSRAKELALLLEKVRAKHGNKPLRLNSVYRTPAYNRLIGGALGSAHTRGFAVDVATPHNKTQEQHHKVMRAVFPNGVGNYPTQKFVHGDRDWILGERNWNG